MEKEDILKGYLSRIIQTTPDFSEMKIKSPDQKSFLKSRYYWLVLDKYIRNFYEGNLKQRVIIIPGLRGIGKTTLLFKAYNHFLNNLKIPKERLLYIDASELKNNIGFNLNELISCYEETYLEEPLEKLKKPLVFFLDEAHYEENWPAVAQTLFNRSEKVLVVVSGSSALALNIGTDLSRRAIKDHLFPLGFNEYLLLKKGFFPPKKTAEKIRIALDSDVESAHNILSNVNKDLQKSFLKNNLDSNKELIEFISLGASPLSLDPKSSTISFRWWREVIEKVTRQDIPSFSKIGLKSSPLLFSLLQFFAQSSPNPQSLQSLSEKLEGVPRSSVANIIDALKNACLIIEIEPSVDPLRKLNKSSKFYFMHPTIRAALLWGIGRFRSDLNLNDSTILGFLFEDALATTLYRNKELSRYIVGLSFDSKDKGCDFILKTPSGNIALECGWGEKTNYQVEESMKRFKCKFGIVVSKTKSVSLKENIITIPRELLLFI